MIHVCSLARLHRTVEETGARHVVTLLQRPASGARGPTCIAEDNHLILGMDDIPEPIDGYVAPGEEHVAQAHRLRARLGPRDAAGRALLCRHQPLDRGRLRRRLRAQSRPRRNCRSRRSCADARDTASPNRRIVSIADDLLGRNGRMVDAIERHRDRRACL